MARIEISNLTRRFGPNVAVDGVSAAIGNREFVALLGPSGCGKTTLLRLLAGFEVPDAGEIALDGRIVSRAGEAVPPEARQIGMVFQSYALWPHMSVAGNVGFPLRVARVPRAERKRRVDEALALVGLADLAGRPPAALSGGQRQRVAVARCLAMRPGLVLLDEPLANLDPHLRESMQAEFRRFHRESGATFVYVTHDQSEALALADRVAVMDRGSIQQIAEPARLYREPATEMVAHFLGRGMVVDAEVVGAAGTAALVEAFGLRFPARGAAAAGERRKLCLKPADLRLANGSGGFAARVADLRFQGAHTELSVVPEQGGAGPLLVEHRGEAPLPGSRIEIAVADAWIVPG